MRVFVLLVPLLLAGCAGSPVGDALAGPEVLAQRDDAYCRSLGVMPNTENYMTCRLTVTQQRNESHAASLALASRAFGTAAILTARPPLQPVQPMTNILPQQTRCRHINYGSWAQTVCQ
jgi:hypothetical protein